MNSNHRLLIILTLYCAASLFHFVHNAVFIDEYPNLPNWISVVVIYITWLGITSIGIVGYLLVHHGKQVIGLITLAAYGTFGLDGLGHYSLAPMSAHTFTMNLTIWLEALTAVIVLITTIWLLTSHFRQHTNTA